MAIKEADMMKVFKLYFEQQGADKSGKLIDKMQNYIEKEGGVVAPDKKLAKAMKELERQKKVAMKEVLDFKKAAEKEIKEKTKAALRAVNDEEKAAKKRLKEGIGDSKKKKT